MCRCMLADVCVQELKNEQEEKRRARKASVSLSAQLEEMKKNAEDFERRLKEMADLRDRAQESEERMSAQLTAEKAR